MFDYHISLVKKKGIYDIAFTSNLPDKNIKKGTVTSLNNRMYYIRFKQWEIQRRNVLDFIQWSIVNKFITSKCDE